MIIPGTIKQYLAHFLLTALCFTLISCGQEMNEQQMLQSAKSHMDKDELMTASIELRNTLKQNKENAEARYLLGNINLKIGDLATAEKEFRRAASAGWDQQAVQTDIARIFITKREFKKLLDEITVENTWSAETKANISALRATAFAGLGQLIQAKETLDEARSYSSDALYVLKATAVFQLAGLHEGDANATLDKALSLYPDNSEILLLQASSNIQNENFKKAADFFSRVIALDPPKLITANGRVAHIGLARLQIIDNKVEEANATLAKLLKRNEKDPEANYLAGLLALHQQKYHAAEEYIRQLLAIAPDHVQSQQVLGKIKYALKDFDQAAHYLSAYLNLNPDDIAVRKLLTNTYILLNQSGLAESTLHGVTAVDPDDPEMLTLLSQIEFNKGDLNAGILSLNKAIKSSPDNIALHKQLAKAYIATGKLEPALAEIKTFHKLSNNTEETWKLGISAYLKMGQIDKAINIANRMLAKNPKDPNYNSLNGSLYALNNNHEKARAYFDKALKLQENLPSATVGLARLEKKEGNIDKAIELYESLVNLNLAGTQPMLALSELAAQQSRTNDMLSWLEKARNAAPGEVNSRIILANYYLGINEPAKANIYVQEALKTSPEQNDLLLLQGKVLIAQKHYHEAEPLLSQLLSKSPDSITIRLLLGETLLHQNRLADARKHFQTILDKQNNNIMAMTLLADTEFKDGKYNKSLEYTKQLQQAQPEHYLGYLLEGNIWFAKHDYNKAHLAYSHAWKNGQTAELAMKLYATANQTKNFDSSIEPLLSWIQKHPDDYTTRFYLATVYQNAQQDTKAIAAYEKILGGTPDNAAVLNNLAWLYSLKDNPKALDYAEKAYRLTQTDPGILDTYGWILVKHGKTQKGLRLLAQAMEQIPDNLEIRYHYAAALIQADNTTEGHQILESLLKLNRPFIGRNEAEQLLANQISSDGI